VDNGGFFPETDDYQDQAWFLMQSMVVLGTDAVGVSEKELRYGRAFLLANAKQSRLPLVCANLIDKTTNKTLVAPYVLKKVGNVTVGIFGLTSDKADLGPARDSVAVDDPTVAGRRVIAEMRKKGASVIVLLSQLGKIESEDYVTAVDSIDVVICGRAVPLLQKGRMVKNTIACYGGEQGQYLGRTIVNLDAHGRMVTADNETALLGPEVGERADILALVKSFEDSFNDKLRKREKEKALQDEAKRASGASGASGPTDQAQDHYVGGDICQRCHKAEYDQWKTTKHAQAWQTLVDAKKDANADCIGCHVAGYKKPGGFQTGEDAARLGNVQCENCHGMGTLHDASVAATKKLTAETCQKCHTSNTSPTFDFSVYEPHILHHVPANMPPLPKSQARERMLGTGK